MHVIDHREGELTRCNNFKDLFRVLQGKLIETVPVDVGEWQSQKLDADNDMTKMREINGVSLHMQLPQSEGWLADMTGAHLPWAEDHFQERVSGKPLNPPPSNEWWPFAQKSNKEHKSEGEAFSHTYPERMWPKEAGTFFNGIEEVIPAYGIRFDYGDLQDVVNLLVGSPNTRQAFLPIWFPEDTGVVHGKRVPCTIGYHFLIRNGALNITYYMRSCDLVRHFQDDVYMAGRLAQWVASQWNDQVWDGNRLAVGKLDMHIANLHVFNGDRGMMEYRQNRGEAWSE